MGRSAGFSPAPTSQDFSRVVSGDRWSCDTGIVAFTPPTQRLHNKLFTQSEKSRYPNSERAVNSNLNAPSFRIGFSAPQSESSIAGRIGHPYYRRPRPARLSSVLAYCSSRGTFGKLMKDKTLMWGDKQTPLLRINCKQADSRQLPRHHPA